MIKLTQWRFEYRQMHIYNGNIEVARILHNKCLLLFGAQECN